MHQQLHNHNPKWQRYWKAMYEMFQSLIEESYGKSLKLGEIPGPQGSPMFMDQWRLKMCSPRWQLWKNRSKEKSKKLKEGRSRKFSKRNSFTDANYSVLV